MSPPPPANVSYRPANANATFTGWSGACSGTNATCTVQAADHRLVVANFQASSTTVVVYHHADALGSLRAITDSAGAVVERHDFRPFGEDTMPLPGTGAEPTRFLGQQRDSTKLDQFGARYYSMFHGRFTGVDPVVSSAAIVLPQKWNRYAYARNNPLRFTDSTGLDDEENEVIENPATRLWCLSEENCKAIEEWEKALEDEWWDAFEARRAREALEEAQEQAPIAIVGAVIRMAAAVVGAVGALFNGAIRAAQPYIIRSTGLLQRPNAQRLFAPGRLEEHFRDHAAEWGGTITQPQYLRRAQDLLSRPIGGDILGFTRAGGDILRYNTRTNEFAVAAADGTIRTLFRPTDGIAYWLRQVSGR